MPHYLLPRQLRGQCNISLTIGAFVHGKNDTETKSSAVDVKNETKSHEDYAIKKEHDCVKEEIAPSPRRAGRPRKSDEARRVPLTGRFGGQNRQAWQGLFLRFCHCC